jgi:hypothetical protein
MPLVQRLNMCVEAENAREWQQEFEELTPLRVPPTASVAGDAAVESRTESPAKYHASLYVACAFQAALSSARSLGWCVSACVCVGIPVP